VNVLHVIPSLSIEDGGPTFALMSLVKALNRSNVQITILTTLPKGANQNDHGLSAGNANVIYFQRNFRPYKVAWKIVPWLVANVRDFDVVHVHAVFSFVSVAAAFIARWKKVPYIVRPLGVLNRWGMHNRRPMAKRLSYRLLESKILRNASTLHFTSKREAEQAHELDPRLKSVPSITLPLPIEVPQHGDEFLERFPTLRDVDWILFLSRFDRQKGLEVLLEAFAKSKPATRECYLVLAGGGDQRYMEELEESVQRFGLKDRVVWTGYLTGREKWSALATSTIFVLPSHSESFGIAAAEALASGSACILSEEVPFARDAADVDAGVAVPCEAGPLRDAIEQLLADSSRRKTLGENAKRYADRNFSPASIALALTERYRALSDLRKR
jgi:glycosyltransferase involved in cell wall biosynthesis